MEFVLTAAEAAEYLGVDAQSVRVWYRQGILRTPHIWNGSRLRIMKYPFLEYLKEKEAGIHETKTEWIGNYFKM